MIRHDLLKCMRERKAKAKSQKYAMTWAAGATYSPQHVWYRVVDGVPRFYTREAVQQDSEGHILEWRWDATGVRFEKGQPGQGRQARAGAAGSGDREARQQAAAPH
jgi:hypothetical protein